MVAGGLAESLVTLQPGVQIPPISMAFFDLSEKLIWTPPSDIWGDRCGVCTTSQWSQHREQSRRRASTKKEKKKRIKATWCHYIKKTLTVSLLGSIWTYTSLFHQHGEQNHAYTRSCSSPTNSCWVWQFLQWNLFNLQDIRNPIAQLVKNKKIRDLTMWQILSYVVNPDWVYTNWFLLQRKKEIK